MSTPNRLLRDSLLAMAMTALGGAAGCSHTATTPAATTTPTAQAAPTTTQSAPSNDLPTATPAPAQPQGVPAGHSCGQGECS